MSVWAAKVGVGVGWEVAMADASPSRPSCDCPSPRSPSAAPLRAELSLPQPPCSPWGVGKHLLTPPPSLRFVGRRELQSSFKLVRFLSPPTGGLRSGPQFSLRAGPQEHAHARACVCVFLAHYYCYPAIDVHECSIGGPHLISGRVYKKKRLTSPKKEGTLPANCL